MLQRGVPCDADLHYFSFSVLCPINELRGARWGPALDAFAQLRVSLLLLIKPNGSKLWYVKCRFGGKEKKMPIGQFPEIGLAHARRIRDVARVKIAEGLDPMLQRKRERMTARINSANSFELVALEYIEERSSQPILNRGGMSANSSPVDFGSRKSRRSRIRLM